MVLSRVKESFSKLPDQIVPDLDTENTYKQIKGKRNLHDQRERNR